MDAMDKIIVPLTRVAAFSGLTQEQFRGIARHAKKLKFLRGDVIIKAGTAGDGAFVIASGPAEREGTHGASAEIVPEGSLIGEMAMLTEHTYQSTVIARDWVFCLKITREGLHAQMREDPDLAEHFRRRVSERMLRVAEDLRRIDRLLATEARAAQQPASPDPGAAERLPAA